MGSPSGKRNAVPAYYSSSISSKKYVELLFGELMNINKRGACNG
jgi:hypothetical protein